MTFLVLWLQFFKSLSPSKVKSKTALAKTKTSKKWSYDQDWLVIKLHWLVIKLSCPRKHFSSIKGYILSLSSFSIACQSTLVETRSDRMNF